MADLKWLAGYSGQSTDELIGLEGEYRSDSLVVAFEEALSRKFGRVGSEGLTEEERVVLAVEALEREVNNGGYNQFFTHSSNVFSPIIVDALRQIGCLDAASLTEKAISALGIEGSVTVEAIESAMDVESEKREEKLDSFDSKYFRVAGDLSVPVLAFIKQNRENIRLVD